MTPADLEAIKARNAGEFGAPPSDVAALIAEIRFAWAESKRLEDGVYGLQVGLDGVMAELDERKAKNEQLREALASLVGTLSALPAPSLSGPAGILAWESFRAARAALEEKP